MSPISRVGGAPTRVLRSGTACGRAMVHNKTIARKAGGGTVPAGVPTPTSLVLTQDVQAAEAQATVAAQRVAQLREAQRQAGVTASKWRT